MLTGCRPNEALRATWQEFDEAPGFWSKPSAHTKQKKTPHRAACAGRARADRATPAGARQGQASSGYFQGLCRASRSPRYGTSGTSCVTVPGSARMRTSTRCAISFASVGAGGGLSPANHRSVARSHAAAHDAALCALGRRSVARGRRAYRRGDQRGREGRRQGRHHQAVMAAMPKAIMPESSFGGRDAVFQRSIAGPG